MDGPRPLVVVVDDSLVVRRMLAHHLEEHGYEVAVAVDGEAALVACSARPPDVILLDLNLPGISGFQVLTALRGTPEVAQTPVIILSERQAAEDAARGLELGAHDYLRKPIEAIELNARVDAALRLRAVEVALRDRNAQLEEVNRTDFLTGLANRRHMDAELDRACSAARRSGAPLGLLIIDIDHFKQINDMAGHVAGDAVLREIGGRIKSLMRAGDTASRWGGDEFLVLMPDTSPDGLSLAGARVRRAAKDSPITTGSDRRLSVAVTVGGAIFVGASVDDFVRSADAALYLGKAGGRDAVVIADAVVTTEGSDQGDGRGSTPPPPADHVEHTLAHADAPAVASRR